MMQQKQLEVVLIFVTYVQNLLGSNLWKIF